MGFFSGGAGVSAADQRKIDALLTFPRATAFPIVTGVDDGSLADTSKGLSLRANAQAAAYNAQIAWQARAVGTWKMYFCWDAGPWRKNYLHSGVAIGLPAGKFLFFNMINNGGARRFAVDAFTNRTTRDGSGSTTYGIDGGSTSVLRYDSEVWGAIEDDGTNLKFSIGDAPVEAALDQIHSTTRGGWLSGSPAYTHLGIAAMAYNETVPNRPIIATYKWFDTSLPVAPA